MMTKSSKKQSKRKPKDASGEKSEISKELNKFLQEHIIPIYVTIGALASSVSGKGKGQDQLSSYEVQIEGIVRIGIRCPSTMLPQSIATVRDEVKEYVSILSPVLGEKVGEISGYS